MFGLDTDASIGISFYTNKNIMGFLLSLPSKSNNKIKRNANGLLIILLFLNSTI